MAQLYFHYSAMNAGKSTHLLQSSFNYKERGMHTLVMTAAIDDRMGAGKVTSRIGIGEEALLYTPETNLQDVIEAGLSLKDIHCILIDESQFLTKEQVWQLTKIVDNFNIPVMCYGLRTDFLGSLFPGSQWLLAWADKLIELKTICHCGKKATMVVRQDADGKVIREGEQVEVGGNESYVSLCRKHWKEALGE